MLLSNSQMVVPGNQSVLLPINFTASPRSPLDMKILLPGSSKRYDNGGIGLGIVAGLEKPGTRINRHQISSKQNPVYYSGSGTNRSNPVHCTRRRFQYPAEVYLSEEYTCVKSRDGPNKIYFNDDEFELCKNKSDGDRRWDKSMDITEEIPAKKWEGGLDFLILCCLCKKKLQGKDIYMYKGDEGFCSKECRSVKIMEDNLKVQHKSSTSAEVFSSSYAGGQIPSAGIFVI
ncbi:unnamed protein product [Thlaspi arvense]|uniref:FLZ-type domain-containing protein n=1 Tax=Thlaspi arvense TaxID=13288 RepID=A0AAU9RA64_THLAR|nr:unnamed protein product [Thlaspi arvense]